jgi:hypothetical protein
MHAKAASGTALLVVMVRFLLRLCSTIADAAGTVVVYVCVSLQCMYVAVDVLCGCTWACIHAVRARARARASVCVRVSVSVLERAELRLL